MKFKTKSIEVNVIKNNSATSYWEYIVIIGAESLTINRVIFDLLFEPIEEESEKQNTLTCESCRREFFLLFKEDKVNAKNLCTDCWNLKIKRGF